MPRLEPIVTIGALRPGWVWVTNPADDAFIEQIEAIPGAINKGHRTSWQFPEEMADWLEDRAREHNFKVVSEGPAPLPVMPENLNEALHQYQGIGVARGLDQTRLMINWETGLGKCLGAIETMRLSGSTNILVVCPAMVRDVWQRELGKWWSVAPASEQVTSGHEAKGAESPICITSYELLPKMLARKWDAIILDEVHFVQNSRARRSLAVQRLCQHHPDAYILGLTATPITNEPKNLWFQLDCLWNNRFGTAWEFFNRYCIIEEGEFGPSVHGLNEEHAAELKMRLAAVCHRVTKKEVAHLLPPLTINTIHIKCKRGESQRELLEDLSSASRKQHDIQLDTMVSRAGAEKIAHAAQLVIDNRKNATHIAVLTHFKDTANELAQLVEEKLAKEKDPRPVIKVDGDIPVKRRGRVLEDAKALDAVVLIATMHSINVGIDLTRFSIAAFAELYWRPVEMIQALGRFSRLSGTIPSTIYLLVLDGSLDEAIAAALHRKLSDAGAIQEHALSEALLTEGLGPEQQNEDEFLKDVLGAIADGIDEDPYL